MKIDPKKITNYNLTYPELEKHLLWWILAAGKNGITASKLLDNLLEMLEQSISISNLSPFTLIRKFEQQELAYIMKVAGIGCYNIKSNTFKVLSESGLDLRTCSVDDLENIKGIGPKTSRCFIIHSRPNQRLAGLDRHILRFLKDKGYNVPTSTPVGKKYKQIEQWFLNEADIAGKSIADLDLDIWNEYRDK